MWPCFSTRCSKGRAYRPHWQSVLERGKFLVSKDGKCIVTASSLSTAPSAARIRPTSVESAKTERIVIRAFHDFADYLRTLPLHESQQELGGDDNSTFFEYHIKPTFDFYQLALAQGDQMEVLEPESVRSKMHRLLANMMQLYR